MNKLSVAVCALLSGQAFCAAAQEMAPFTDTSISALSGGKFRLDPEDQTTFTLEQVHSGAWGDTYWFVDAIHFDHEQGKDNTWYGEFSARVSAKKLGWGSPAKGPLRDILLATTYERGKDRGVAEAALVGIGTDWKLPGFSYFQANVYARKELYAGGWDSWQITLSGAVPFHIGAQKFVVDGFIDYVGQGGIQHENLHVVPQIKWDLGSAVGTPAGKLWLGVEVDWWRNKYGVDDRTGLATNQKAASVLLRWHF